eukprot:CAMPEP_0182424948 /NCGR_PEP_ID=MMETSP1167-20130531/11251_1 /TAXON_ID=2988 /ORGANISM="Mallomonas Sp, Strain CCMP3275" /LENGTH=225 /DNA_ID=CAMNT_0024605171 /DNA_START=103 /DNA_END=777 /DNA_ORIENTATION=+
MIGDLDEVDDEYTNYFKSGCHPSDVPDYTIDAVEIKLRECLDREGLGLPYKSNVTARRILIEILKNHGSFLEGKLTPSLNALSSAIMSMTSRKSKFVIKDLLNKYKFQKLKSQEATIESLQTEVTQLKELVEELQGQLEEKEQDEEILLEVKTHTNGYEETERSPFDTNIKMQSIRTRARNALNSMYEDDNESERDDDTIPSPNKPLRLEDVYADMKETSSSSQW